MAQIAQLFAHPQPNEMLEALRICEALLFAASEPLSEAQLAARMPDSVELTDVLAELRRFYAPRGVNLVKAAGKWTFRTAGDLGWLLSKDAKEQKKLSRAALETLAICAYHQPVTRAEIEDIRGVAISKGTLDVLLETGWVRLRGRRKAPGRPVTYGTTDAFLEHYGLANLGDLPGASEMKAAGLLSLDLPADFAVPDPNAAAPDEDLFEDGETPEFHVDYIGEEQP